MVDKIVKFLVQALAIALTGNEIAALKLAIEVVFTGLKYAKEGGFASFRKSSQAHYSSWEYRILFAFPNPDLPTDFYSMVTTIQINADIEEESSWWGLTSSSKKNFSASVSALRLVVTKGFKSPQQQNCNYLFCSLDENLLTLQLLRTREVTEL